MTFTCSLLAALLFGTGGGPGAQSAPLRSAGDFHGVHGIHPDYTIETWLLTVSSGGYSCGIATDGTLWCWGDNSVGQLGIGSQGHSADVSAPYEVGALTTWVALTAGTDHTCGTQTNGSMWCWGNNSSGQLGDGSTVNRVSPVRALASGAAQPASGFAHTCTTETDGTLWCWGSNSEGQLGLGDTVSRDVPTQVGSATTWTSVSAGGNHTCATQDDGSLWCWGDNSHGELGQRSAIRRSTPLRVGDSSTMWSQVSAGDTHTCGIQTPRNTLWCWGEDGVNGKKNQPRKVGNDTNWATVSAGADDTCGTQSDNTLWCWGVNSQGQLGQGGTTSSQTPLPVDFRLGWTIVGVGGGHTCVIRLDSTMWCFGDDEFGQLGDHARTDRFLPTPIILTSPWTTVSDDGGSQTCAASDLRPLLATLWCWGLNDHGQVGDGTTTDRSLPVQIASPTTWSAVDGGEAFTCGIQVTANETLWCWGDNNHGQLGVGDTNDRLTPTQVGSATIWLSVATGDDHACGIQQPGILWCWGNNTEGEVGDGTTADAVQPIQVGSVQTWVSVSPGVSHTCAIQKNGTLWCWGDNADGQLGDGTTTQRNVPVQVGSSHSWASVSTGGDFTCGVQTTGTLWCWGVNNHGQSGQPAGVDLKVPTQVGTSTSWMYLSSGLDHSCGTQSTLTLWCWGNERDGDLGDGIVTGERDAPTRVIYQAGDPWGIVHAYDDRTCAIKSFMECFGDDATGQLGDGSPVPYRLSPSIVLIIPK